jgi:hypothetical protein
MGKVPGRWLTVPCFSSQRQSYTSFESLVHTISPVISLFISVGGSSLTRVLVHWIRAGLLLLAALTTEVAVRLLQRQTERSVSIRQ